MIVLGLLLIVLAGATVIAVSWDETAASTATASFTIFDRTVQLSQLELFCAGVAVGAVFLLGLMIMFAGMRRSSAPRRKLRSSRSEARDRVARLEEEKRELERKLDATPEVVGDLAVADPAPRAGGRCCGHAPTVVVCYLSGNASPAVPPPAPPGRPGPSPAAGHAAMAAKGSRLA